MLKDKLIGLEIHYEVNGQTRSQFWESTLLTIAGQPSEHSSSFLITQKYKYKIKFVYLMNQGQLAIFRVAWYDWHVSNGLSPEMKAMLHEILRLSPTYIQRDEKGHLQFANPQATESWQRQAIGSILWPFQFVCAGKTERTWRVQEAHYSAPVICRYRLVKADRLIQIYNKSVESVIISDEEKQMGKTHQILGYLQYRFNLSGWPDSVNGTLRERVAIKGLPASSNEVSLKIKFIGKSKIDANQLLKWKNEAQTILKKAKLYSLYAPPTEIEQAKQRAQAILSSTTPQQLLSELEASVKRLPESPQERANILTQMALKLESGIVLYPNLILPKIQQILYQIDSANDVYWMILSVLSNSTYIEAQHLLLDQIQQSGSVEKQLAAARQIAQIEKPSEQIFEAIWKLDEQIKDEDIRKHLEVSLSILARKLFLLNKNSKSLERFNAWVAQHLAKAVESRQEAEQLHWLIIAGNWGQSEVLPFVERLARSGTPNVRLAAIDALRHQNPDPAIRLLEKLYPLEPLASIRQKMIEILSQWWQKGAARTLIEQAVFGDPAPSVRRVCISTLTDLAYKHKDALDMLVRAAETNSMPEIRREAMVALASLHAQGISVPPIKSPPPN
ncbi:hypothetical protein HRbin15_01647 [bacterium HR15]|nr:hypothetical protein HRbin15_01647 [bacterium HR15]